MTATSSSTSASPDVLPVDQYIAGLARKRMATGVLFRDVTGRVLLVVDYVRPQDSRPEGVVFVFDGGVLDETDVVGMMFPDAEILSAGFYSLDQVAERVKPLLADRLAAALEAVDQGVTVLCEQGRRINPAANTLPGLRGFARRTGVPA